MTGADYKIRRMIADRLLSTIEMPKGAAARIGEGAKPTWLVTWRRRSGRMRRRWLRLRTR